MESLPVTCLELVPASPLGVQDLPPVSVRTYRYDNWLVVEVAGEIDVFGAPYLRPFLEEHPFVVLDLRRVSFMDCGGLRLLADRTRTVSGVSGCFRVAGASRWVRRLVRLCPFDEPVPMFDSVRDALSTPITSPPKTSGR